MWNDGAVFSVSYEMSDEHRVIVWLYGARVYAVRTVQVLHLDMRALNDERFIYSTTNAISSGNILVVLSRALFFSFVTTHMPARIRESWTTAQPSASSDLIIFASVGNDCGRATSIIIICYEMNIFIYADMHELEHRLPFDVCSQYAGLQRLN